jgi:hypothetical protein
LHGHQQRFLGRDEKLFSLIAAFVVDRQPNRECARIILADAAKYGEDGSLIQERESASHACCHEC